MKNYNKPNFKYIPMDLNESIATSAEHFDEDDEIFYPEPEDDALEEVVPDPEPEDDEEPQDTLITVELGDDPEKNRDILNEALERGDVVIGNPRAFLIAPGVIINGHTLDLAWSSLTGSVEPFYNGAYFRLCGDGPCIKNGSFEGHYNAGPGEEGYIPLEVNGVGIETVVDIPAGSFENAVIDNVSFRHVSGYVICPRSQLLNAIRHFSPATEPEDGWSRFDLISGYNWVTARHGVGYNYCISRGLVEYRFYDENDELLDTLVGTPGNVMYVPEGSKYVKVQTEGPYLQYCLFEYEYVNTIEISNCHFAFNQRLAIANLPGPSIVRDCASISNGYPRADHSTVDRWDSSTSGFIDIEDVQSPELRVLRCSSLEEHLGVASRAYEFYIDECPTLDIFLYDGWDARIYNVNRVYFINQKAKDAIKLKTDAIPTVLY